MKTHQSSLTIGLAQIAPVWLNRAATLRKVVAFIEEAAAHHCELVAFGEALVPGYPFWVELTDGARFNSALQKSIYAEYAEQAIQPEAGHLDTVCEAAARHRIAVYLGTIERAVDRGGHSLYCSLVYIAPDGAIGSIHRKLMPTHEERLVWSPGDGHGLRTHALDPFRVGGLNCWENWMPLSRTALYAQGEDLHVAVWPGNARNTQDITKFIALESRSYVASVSGLMRREDIGSGSAWREAVSAAAPDILANGGSCLAGPDGEWILPPAPAEEKLYTATLDFRRILEERQNFDVAGHYSRPDVTRLEVDRRRQSLLAKHD
ncbi:MAG TPA: carbon-nitrogen hydrolase family protein [Candidatus Sulfopaludibacter sp.]|jgi:nitrilase|nr:carbon-nitrogen hydrolase family protein [Candidatus Sulfopaludibacter sp.]